MVISVTTDMIISVWLEIEVHISNLAPLKVSQLSFKFKFAYFPIETIHTHKNKFHKIKHNKKCSRKTKFRQLKIFERLAMPL